MAIDLARGTRFYRDNCFVFQCPMPEKIGGEAQRMMQPSSSETPERDTYADPIQSILITSVDTFADAGLDCRMPDSQPLGEYGPNRRYQVRGASPRSATCGFSRSPSFRQTPSNWNGRKVRSWISAPNPGMNMDALAWKPYRRMAITWPIS